MPKKLGGKVAVITGQPQGWRRRPPNCSFPPIVCPKERRQICGHDPLKASVLLIGSR